MFAFADPEIIQLAQTAFVPVCADDWYQRRRSDAEGKFWESVWKQGPRSKDAPTHQGIYVLTASGELLGFGNAGQDPDATRRLLHRALMKWNALPDTVKAPGAIVIPEHGPLDPDYTRTPPQDGAIIRVHARILDRKGEDYHKGTCAFAGGDRASRDFLWITSEECRKIARKPNQIGRRTEFPRWLLMRIARFHLVDNTRGEPDFWARPHVRIADATMTAEATNNSERLFRIDGRVLLETERSERGYDARLGGWLSIAMDGHVKRFDVVAIGEHWGTGDYTKTGERPGRTLLGISMECVDAAVPANQVAPQAARDIGAYFEFH